MQKVQKVKGTRDLLGNEIILHKHIIAKFEKLCNSLNFSQISTPILEYVQIFTKSLGLSSDIVSKEMYNFEDQGKEKLVLRLRDEGESYRGIREQTGLGLATIRRIIADRDALLEQSLKLTQNEITSSIGSDVIEPKYGTVKSIVP